MSSTGGNYHPYRFLTSRKKEGPEEKEGEQENILKAGLQAALENTTLEGPDWVPPCPPITGQLAVTQARAPKASVLS